jgi:hypothetical protein
MGCCVAFNQIVGANADAKILKAEAEFHRLVESTGVK